MTPYTNDSGLRDYHATTGLSAGKPHLWPWLVLLACLAGLLLRVLR
jgi:hypothetical protein